MEVEKSKKQADVVRDWKRESMAHKKKDCFSWRSTTHAFFMHQHEQLEQSVSQEIFANVARGLFIV